MQEKLVSEDEVSMTLFGGNHQNEHVHFIFYSKNKFSWRKLELSPPNQMQIIETNRKCSRGEHMFTRTKTLKNVINIYTNTVTWGPFQEKPRTPPVFS